MIMHVAKILCGLGRLTVVFVVVVEFAGYVPVLYGARPVGWTSLYATRAVVCLSPPMDKGWFYVPMVRQWLWVCPVICWRSQVYLVLCACAAGWSQSRFPVPFLVPWSRKSRAIPLHPLWAIRPVQSLSACTMVHFKVTLP